MHVVVVSMLQCPSTSATGQSPVTRQDWPLLLPEAHLPVMLQSLAWVQLEVV